MLRKLMFYLCTYIRHGTYVKMQWRYRCLHGHHVEGQSSRTSHTLTLPVQSAPRSRNSPSLAPASFPFHSLIVTGRCGINTTLASDNMHSLWLLLNSTSAITQDALFCAWFLLFNSLLIQFINIVVTVDWAFLMLPRAFYHLCIWMVIGIWVVSSCWLFQVMLLWTF